MTSLPRKPATAALAVALTAALSFTACGGADEPADASPDDTTTSTAVDADASAGTALTETATDDTADSDAGADAGTDAGAGAVDQAQLDALLANVDDAYRRIDGAWDGFRPNEHPVVLGWKDGAGRLIGAVAINHPDPDAIGPATAFDAADRSYDSAHLITDVADDAAGTLQSLLGFEFETTIGGADSFLMVAGGDDSFFDPTRKDYGSTLLHEMFHRYQIKSFVGQGGLQDVEGYAYTAENLELAALEERALTVALESDTDDERRTAASHAAAIRIARRAADDRVVLDDDQERFEGTARYIEHRLGGDGTGDGAGYVFDDGNYGGELLADPVSAQGVKNHYGFGRFYDSGASVMGLLDDLGADDPTGEVQGGEYPMSLLATELGVTDDDVDRLVAEARRQYDPLGELEERATEAAEQAADEPPVFGDESFGGADGGPLDGEGAEIGPGAEFGEPITDDELACLEENGMPIGEEELEIPEDIAEKCLGPFPD